MTLRVKVSARAALQVRRAAEWWLENRPSAPGAIAKDFGETIALLAEQPGIGVQVDDALMRQGQRLSKRRAAADKRFLRPHGRAGR